MVELTVSFRRAFDREIEVWELQNPAARSQLPDDLAAAMVEVALHPYVGRRVRGRDNDRKMQLRRTGFFIVYRVYPRLRMIRIVSLAPKASLAHRR